MQKFFGLTAEDLKLVNIVDGDTVRIGSEELEVVDVPGHTKLCGVLLQGLHLYR